MADPTLNDVVNMITAATGQIQTRMDGLQRSIDGLATKADLARVEGKADAHRAETRADLQNLDERVEKLDERVEKLDERVEKLDERVEKLDERVEKLDERVEKLDEAVTVFKADATKALAELDTDLTGHMMSHRELEKEIEALKRRPARSTRPTRRR